MINRYITAPLGARPVSLLKLCWYHVAQTLTNKAQTSKGKSPYKESIMMMMMMITLIIIC